MVLKVSGKLSVFLLHLLLQVLIIGGMGKSVRASPFRKPPIVGKDESSRCRHGAHPNSLILVVNQANGGGSLVFKEAGRSLLGKPQK
jgi:hypothetical protein